MTTQKELCDFELKGESVLQLQDFKDQWLDIDFRLSANMDPQTKMEMLMEKLGDHERVERAVQKFLDTPMAEWTYDFLWTLFENHVKVLKEKNNYRINNMMPPPLAR